MRPFRNPSGDSESSGDIWPAQLIPCLPVSQSIRSRLERVLIVAFDPPPPNVHPAAETDQFSPEFLVLQLDAAAIAPPLYLPTEDSKTHSVD